MSNTKIFVVSLALALSACGESGQGPLVDGGGPPTAVPQGMNLQGMNLQGMNLQGMNLQGIRLGGLTLTGTQLNGLVAGGKVTGVDALGNTVDLQVSDIETDLDDATGDILLYTLLSFNQNTMAWENVCQPTLSLEQKAIAVAGYWDKTGAHINSSTIFTFGCTSGVIAKCVRWGYKPWKMVNGVSLTPYHEACTRMARADYCGNGNSHTINGTLIEIYDNLKIQTPTPGTKMLFEAAWTPQGAYCLGKERWYGVSSTGQLLGDAVLTECPRQASLVSPAEQPTPDTCYIKLIPNGKGAVLMSNKSNINLTSSLSGLL